jgi:hypothetical protein
MSPAREKFLPDMPHVSIFETWEIFKLRWGGVI